MTAVKANEAGADPPTEQSLTLKDIDLIAFNFFEFLHNKSYSDIEFNYNMQEKTLHLIVKDVSISNDVKQLKAALDNPCKQIYQLQEQQINAADDFVNDWESSRDIESVFVFRSKHQFAIMASKDHCNTFKEYKRKFEVTVLKLGYYTFEKIEVRILNENLKNLDDVDAIVNPTNERLEQKGRVSTFLSVEGGTAYDEECKQLKTLTARTCFVTSWGNKQGTKILHAVCPDINKKKSQDVQTIIYETVYSCLKKAEKEEVETVAIPFVYTGRGKVAVDKCAFPYVQAVLQFSMDRESAFCVNRIDFIDHDKEKTETLRSYFDDLLPINISQQFEIPIRENPEVRGTAQHENDSMKESPKSSEVKEINSNVLPINQLPMENCVDDGGYEIIDSMLDHKLSNETTSTLQNPDVILSDIVDKHIKSTIENGYEDFKFADDIDEDGSDKVAVFSLESKVVKSVTEICCDTIDENTETKSNEHDVVISNNSICKDQVETLRSGLKIIYADLDDERKRQTITEYEGYESVRNFSNTNTEKETGIVSIANVHDYKHTTRSSRSAISESTEVKNKGDLYENLLRNRNSNDYENNESCRDTVNDALKTDSKKVGNIVIIDETKCDEVCTKNEDVMKDKNADKAAFDYINIQPPPPPPQQQQLEAVIDTCDYGSVNTKNESEYVYKDTETQSDTKSVIEKQTNYGEKKIDRDEKERHHEDKNPSLDVLHSDKENVEGEVGEKEDQYTKSHVKPYCDITVEIDVDHEYYNVEKVPKSKLPRVHEPKQVLQSPSTTQQQQQQQQLETVIDTCDYDSVNTKNEIEHVIKDTETQADTKSVIEKQTNYGEKKIDRDEKGRHLEDKNPSLDVLHSYKENVEGKIGEKGDQCVKSHEKPYCDITVEIDVDHEYYNLQPLVHEPKQVLQSPSTGDTIYQMLDDNYETKLAGVHTVKIFKGDIRKTKDGVIICPEIPNTKYGGILAVAIKCTFRDVVGVEIPQKLIKSKGKRVATTNCRLNGSVNGLEDERVSYIYHLLTPIYKTTEDGEGVTRCVDLIFKKLKEHRSRQVKRIYMPLLGIEDVSNEDNIKTCCQILVKAIHKNISEHKSLRDPVEVMLVNRCKQITDMLIKEMKIIAE